MPSHLFHGQESKPESIFSASSPCSLTCVKSDVRWVEKYWAQKWALRVNSCLLRDWWRKEKGPGVVRPAFSLLGNLSLLVSSLEGIYLKGILWVLNGLTCVNSLWIRKHCREHRGYPAVSQCLSELQRWPRVAFSAILGPSTQCYAALRPLPKPTSPDCVPHYLAFPWPSTELTICIPLNFVRV